MIKCTYDQLKIKGIEITFLLTFFLRSAVWLKLQKYEECIDDIEAAILFQYPDNMLYKLIDRKAKCLTALGDADAAKKCYNRVILLLPQSGLDDSKQATWKKDINAEITKLKSLKSKEWTPSSKGSDNDGIFRI